MDKKIKAKAAAIGVIFFLLEEKKEKKKKNPWALSGRIQIMRERQLIFTRNFKTWNQSFILGRQIS